jgi:hypothetical protein
MLSGTLQSTLIIVLARVGVLRSDILAGDIIKLACLSCILALVVECSSIPRFLLYDAVLLEFQISGVESTM